MGRGFLNIGCTGVERVGVGVPGVAPAAIRSADAGRDLHSCGGVGTCTGMGQATEVGRGVLNIGCTGVECVGVPGAAPAAIRTADTGRDPDTPGGVTGLLQLLFSLTASLSPNNPVRVRRITRIRIRSLVGLGVIVLCPGYRCQGCHG